MKVRHPGFGPPMPTAVFYGLAIASVGGPLALVSLFLPNAIASTRTSGGLLVVLGAGAFALPVVAWYRYASRVASSGGLYSFVAVAAGTKLACLQGAIWSVSYFLYLPSTVAFVVYDVLPIAFPGVAPYRAAINVAIPVAMVLGLVGARLGLYTLTAAVGIGQVVLVAVLAAMEIAHTNGPATAFALQLPAGTMAQSAGSVSLLFVCASLPLFLGSEVRRARAVTARAVPLAVGVGALCGLAGVLSLGRFPGAVLSAEVPGWLLGRSLGGRAFGDVVVVGTALSLLTLVLLEYVGLTRLLPAMAPVRPRYAELGVGALFIISAGLSLAGPDAAYERLLNPSLIALYLSQLFVFAVYPRFRRRTGALRLLDTFVAVAAAALMLYGLYLALKPSTGL